MLHHMSKTRTRPDTDRAVIESMKSLFATLSEDELDAFEDDLNFCRFTGLPSERIEAMLRIVAQATPALSAMLNEVDVAA